MTAILVAFFGIVIAVNFTMARLAISSFGGTVVDNSYVASQNYNDWLADADAQAKLGWHHQIQLSPDRHILFSLSNKAGPIPDVRAFGTTAHPLGKLPPRELEFVEVQTGLFRSRTALPPGRWLIQLTARKNADVARYRQELK
jgi:nitrogen fixation protein FixH